MVGAIAHSARRLSAATAAAASKPISPAASAAPSDVVSRCAGRRTGTCSRSACICARGGEAGVKALRVLARGCACVATCWLGGAGTSRPSRYHARCCRCSCLACISSPFCDAPPSTNMQRRWLQSASCFMASRTSRVWKQMASSIARTTCACDVRGSHGRVSGRRSTYTSVHAGLNRAMFAPTPQLPA